MDDVTGSMTAITLHVNTLSHRSPPSLKSRHFSCTDWSAALTEGLITTLSVYKSFQSPTPLWERGGAVWSGSQDAMPCRSCWSPHDTPPLWCCTWPSINKQMKGSPWRSAELSWPICLGGLSTHGDPKWPPAASACQTAPNLVFSDGQEGKRGGRGGARGRC